MANGISRDHPQGFLFHFQRKFIGPFFNTRFSLIVMPDMGFYSLSERTFYFQIPLNLEVVSLSVRIIVPL